MDQTGAIDVYFTLFLGTGAMLLLVTGAILIFWAYYRKTNRLQKAQYEMERTHREQLLFSNLKTLEDERLRFARDIHDEIGVNLSTISMRLAGLKQQTAQEEYSALLNDLLQVVQQALYSTRRIAHNLIPPGIDTFGLHHILEEQASLLTKGTTLHVSVRAMENILRPPFEAELILYRMMQELLQNSIRYSHAASIEIEFSSNEKEYLIRYADNGIGCNLSEVRAGLGLGNIENRAKMLGASCLFKSAPGEGFKAFITLPFIQSHSLS